MIWRFLGHVKAEKIPQRQGVRHPPGDSSLGVDAFKVAKQQHAEINSWGEAGKAHSGGVKAFTEILQPTVDLVLVENLVDLCVKRMTSGFYDIGSSHEHRLLFRLSPAHCHKTIILINVL